MGLATSKRKALDEAAARHPKLSRGAAHRCVQEHAVPPLMWLRCCTWRDLTRWRAVAPSWRSMITVHTKEAITAWRRELKVGDVIDARDRESRWYDAVIVAVARPVGVAVDAAQSHGLVRVHFRGWSSKWDEWVCRNDKRLQPFQMITREWRSLLKVGEIVEFSPNWTTQPSKPVWNKGRVIAISDVSRVLSTVQVKWAGGTAWCATDSEQLCRPGTHIREVRPLLLE